MLDKLISSHPQALVLSQPLPLLYVALKRVFLENQYPAAESRYPLNDMIGSNFYDLEPFCTFLDTYAINPWYAHEILDSMRNFSGQMSRLKDPSIPNDHSYNLYEFFTSWCRRFISGSPPAVLGAKETFIEEFIPWALHRGIKVIQMIRDPRDYISSLEYGRGKKFGGRRKPLLFNLRAWRKSVAFALAHQGHPDFFLLPYEALACHPKESLNRVMDFCGLSPLDERALSEIKDQSGKPWTSNSSHEKMLGISSQSVGRWKTMLEPNRVAVIESLCWHEMKALGYEVKLPRKSIIPVLTKFSDTEKLERPELAFWRFTPERFSEEKVRLQCLSNHDYEPKWFIFEKAFQHLSTV